MIPAHILSAAVFAYERERVESIGRGQPFNEVTGLERAVEAAFEAFGLPTVVDTRETGK